MTIVYVTYAGDAATRFDREYYVAHHLPLVLRHSHNLLAAVKTL